MLTTSTCNQILFSSLSDNFQFLPTSRITSVKIFHVFDALDASSCVSYNNILQLVNNILLNYSLLQNNINFSGLSYFQVYACHMARRTNKSIAEILTRIGTS